jgi:hypothetical protein
MGVLRYNLTSGQEHCALFAGEPELRADSLAE